MCRRCDPPEHLGTRSELKRHQREVYTLNDRNTNAPIASIARNPPYSIRGRRGRGGRNFYQQPSDALPDYAQLGEKIADSISIGNEITIMIAS